MSHRAKLEALAEKRSAKAFSLDPELAENMAFGESIAAASRNGSRSDQPKEKHRPSKLRAQADMAELEEDPKYAGKVVSRPRYQNEDEDEEEDDEDVVGEEEESEDSSDENESEEDVSQGAVSDDTDAQEARRSSKGAAKGLAEDLDAELLALERTDAQALIAANKHGKDEAAQGMRVREQLVSNPL
jgi:hypothetical protein